MSEALKAFVVIFTLSLGGFVYARMAFNEIADSKTLGRWRTIFLAAAAATFLIPNFWLVLTAVAAICIVLGAAEKNKPALYFLLLFAFPVAGAVVPGFGGIKNFLYLTPFNVLAICILLPLLFARREIGGRGVGAMTDIFFFSYAFLMLALSFRDTTITDGFRQSTTFALTAFGPYLALSRMNWTKERLRLATLAFALPLIILSGIAVAEVALNWHFYKSAVDNWGVQYLVRYSSRSGFLRAHTSVFGPISFGLFLAAAVPLALALISSIKRRSFAILGLCAICVGLLSTFSRGPWVGAAFAVVVFVAASDRVLANMTRLAFAGIAGTLALLATPMGDNIINMLPFIGDTSADSIDYRQRLADIGWRVAMQNPWFGSVGYLDTPAMQTLIQGQGIIDIVNSYLRIALESGFVGLSLFAGVSAFSLLTAYRAVGRARRFDPELAVYAQAWLAALAGTLLTLATTSNIVAQVAEVHWLLCGVCVGVARAVAAAAEAAKAGARPQDEPPPAGKPPLRKAAAEQPVAAGQLPPHLRQYVKRG